MRVSSPLIGAARDGDVESVRELLAAGADPNERAGNDQFDDPPLADAVEAGSIECVRLLLAAGADVNAHLGYAAIAARATSAAMLRVLLDAGADPAWQGLGEGLAKHIAMEGAISIDERFAMLRLLREYGGDIDRGERSFPVLWAIAQCSEDDVVVDALAALLRAGADPLVEPNPLGGAVWGWGSACTEQAIDLLVEVGCDIHVRDDNGLGLMHGALMPYSHGRGFMSSDGINVPAIRALLRHGLSIDVTFPDGWRPLHVAANEQDPEAVGLLLSAGASPHERTPDGRTPRNVAVDRKRQHEQWANERTGAAQGSDDARFRDSLLSKQIPEAGLCIALLEAAERSTPDPPS